LKFIHDMTINYGMAVTLISTLDLKSPHVYALNGSHRIINHC